MSGHKKNILLLLVLLSFLFCLRFIHLGADPPSRLSISMGYIGDPGNYVSNARNKIIFGTWEKDMWNIMYISPLPLYLTYGVFLISGIGIAQMNFIPALFSSLILLFTFLFIKRNYTTAFALIAVFLLGVNYQFTMFSRIAVRVMPMVFFAVLAFYFLTVWNKKNFWIFLAGVSSFISFTVKGTSLLILPSYLLGFSLYSFFQSHKKIKKTSIHLAVLFSGMAFVFIFWLLIFYLPHKEIFLAYGTENFKVLTPHTLANAVKNFWIRPLFYFSEMPLLSVLSSVYLLVLVYRVLSYPIKISLVDWICGFWIISNSLYFSVIYYRAARHFIPVILPVVILSVSLLQSLYKLKAVQKPRKIPLFFFPFLFIWLIYFLSSLIIIFSRPTSLPAMQAKSLQVAGLSLIITLIFLFLFRYWPQGFQIPLTKVVKITVISILLLGYSFSHGKRYLNWALFPRYDIQNTSRDIGRAFDHMVIAGLIAPVMVLENRHEAHGYYTNYINPWKDFIKRFNITHIFTTTYAVEKKYYERDFPDVMKRARLLARYHIWRDHVELYDINPPPIITNAGKDVFEGEIFYSQWGIPRYDKNASGKLAFLAEKNKKGNLIELPGLEYPSGNYEAVFFLKGENDIPGIERVARVDIAATTREKVFALKNLYARDFSLPGEYQGFSLSFRLKRSTKVRIRIYSTGKMNLWVDRVAVRPSRQESSRFIQ